MIDRPTGLKRPHEIPKPDVVARELHIAETHVDYLRRLLRLSETLYRTRKTQQDRKGGSQ